MIQARDATFNLAFGVFIKPLERIITKKHKKKINFGKGDKYEVASRIHQLKKKYNWYTEGDHSTFDSHVTVEHLRVTHWYYRKCYQPYQNELNRLMEKTIKNKCRSRNGDAYEVIGTRMSGDMDTSFGNCLINYAILRQVLKDLHIKGDAIVNGDDFILFTNKPVDIDVFALQLRKYNMETGMKPSTDNIHTVEFCRSKYVLNDAGDYCMMTDPTRLAKIFGMTNRPVKSYQQYLLEVIHANQSMNRGSPTQNLWNEVRTLITPYLTKTKYATTAPKKFRNIVSKFVNKKFTIDDMTNQHRRYMHHLRREDCTPSCVGEVTISSIWAYPEIIYIDAQARKIVKRVLSYFQIPHPYTIDHLKRESLTEAGLIVDHAAKAITII